MLQQIPVNRQPSNYYYCQYPYIPQYQPYFSYQQQVYLPSPYSYPQICFATPFLPPTGQLTNQTITSHNLIADALQKTIEIIARIQQKKHTIFICGGFINYILRNLKNLKIQHNQVMQTICTIQNFQDIQGLLENNKPLSNEIADIDLKSNISETALHEILAEMKKTSPEYNYEKFSLEYNKKLYRIFLGISIPIDLTLIDTTNPCELYQYNPKISPVEQFYGFIDRENFQEIRFFTPALNAFKQLRTEKLYDIDIPQQSFLEDPKRIFRAIYMRTRDSLQFSVSVETAFRHPSSIAAINKLKTEELISQLNKLLKRQRANHHAKLMENYGILNVLFPGLVFTENRKWLSIWFYKMLEENVDKLNKNYGSLSSILSIFVVCSYFAQCTDEKIGLMPPFITNIKTYKINIDAIKPYAPLLWNYIQQTDLIDNFQICCEAYNKTYPKLEPTLAETPISYSSQTTELNCSTSCSALVLSPASCDKLPEPDIKETTTAFPIITPPKLPTMGFFKNIRDCELVIRNNAAAQAKIKISKIKTTITKKKLIEPLKAQHTSSVSTKIATALNSTKALSNSSTSTSSSSSNKAQQPQNSGSALFKAPISPLTLLIHDPQTPASTIVNYVVDIHHESEISDIENNPLLLSIIINNIRFPKYIGCALIILVTWFKIKKPNLYQELVSPQSDPAQQFKLLEIIISIAKDFNEWQVAALAFSTFQQITDKLREYIAYGKISPLDKEEFITTAALINFHNIEHNNFLHTALALSHTVGIFDQIIEDLKAKLPPSKILELLNEKNRKTDLAIISCTSKELTTQLQKRNSYNVYLLFYLTDQKKWYFFGGPSSGICDYMENIPNLKKTQILLDKLTPENITYGLRDNLAQNFAQAMHQPNVTPLEAANILQIRIIASANNPMPTDKQIKIAKIKAQHLQNLATWCEKQIKQTSFLCNNNNSSSSSKTI